MIFYRLGILFYQLLILLFSFWNKKAKKAIDGRKKWELQAIKNPKKTASKRLWIHAASLGEYEQAVPLIEHYKSRGYEILVSFFSPSGYEARKNADLIDHVCYLPFDSPKNAKDFIQLWQPDLIFIVKYEFWFFFLDAIKKAQIPCYLISGVFRKDQIFFKKYWGHIFTKRLSAFTYFFLQDAASSQLLDQLGYQNQEVTGDTRFDRVAQFLNQDKALVKIETFCKSDSRKVIILGSSWPKEEQLFQNIYAQLQDRFKVIIAPHDIHSKHIKEIEQKFKAYSCFKHEDYNEGTADILIIDHIGSLSHAYQFADIAFIGGAFGSGLHNILEAIIWGKPIIFGPKHRKFHEAAKAIAHGLAYEIKTSEVLLSTIKQIEQSNAKIFQEKADTFIEANKNATRKIIHQIDLASFN